jgi:hypothetical protein
MESFNAQWRKYLKDKGLENGVHDNHAYKEFYRTKGLSAFNFEIQPMKKVTVNQYFTKYVWGDGSMLKVSSCRNNIDRNSVRYYPSENNFGFAERMLFGISNLMPWDNNA